MSSESKAQLAAQLNDKQKAFCHEYVKDLSATQAAIRAGYSERTADRQGPRLLCHAVVKQYLTILKNERNDQADVDAQYVLNRLVEIDQLDVIDILDDNGDLLPVRQWPKSWRISISAIDVRKVITAGEDRQQLEQVITKIKWPDKARNLELLGKHVKVRAWEKEAVQAGETVAEALREIAEAMPN